MIRIPAIRVALVVAAIFTSLAMPSAQTARPAAAVADVPRLPFETFTLPNGLQVILSQDRRLPLVAVNLWYHVGPANEEPGRTGFAHLFEHLMFQGSKHTPPDSHFLMLEAAGATGINGTTDYDRTNYFETLPSNQLELALWIESDRMGYLLDTVDQAALSNQQDVVRNERRQSLENQPYGIAEEEVVQLLYPKGHPYYGYVIGTHEDIQAAKLEDVKQFFKRYYAPNNASLAIVGDIDPARRARWCRSISAALKRGQPVPPIQVETPKITSERRAHGRGSRRAAADLHDVADVANLHARRCRRGHRGDGAWRRPLEPSLQEAGARAANRAGRQRRPAIADSRLAIPDHRDGPARTHARRDRARGRCGAARRCAPRHRTRAKSSGRATRSKRGSSPALEGLGGFGGVADRLNSYNHYLKTPELPAAGHRALSRRYARRRARVREDATYAVLARRRARGQGHAEALRARRRRRRCRRRPDKALNRSTSTSRGARIRRSRRPRVLTCKCRRLNRSRWPTG